MKRSFSKSDSAVSEVIGNIQIFAIVVVSIGLVMVVGGPILTNAQDSAKLDYIISTFVILQSDINRVAYNQAPFQNMDLKLGGGSLVYGPDGNITNITVQINGTNFSNSDYIEYSYKGNKIAYISGGVYEIYRSGSWRMISAPRIFVRQNMTYISMYHLSGNGSRGGIGNVKLSLHYNETRVDTFRPIAGSNLTISLNGLYADVQGNYLEDQGFTKITGNNYTIASETVTISQYFITIND